MRRINSITPAQQVKVSLAFTAPLGGPAPSP